MFSPWKECDGRVEQIASQQPDTFSVTTYNKFSPLCSNIYTEISNHCEFSGHISSTVQIPDNVPVTDDLTEDSLNNTSGSSVTMEFHTEQNVTLINPLF